MVAMYTVAGRQVGSHILAIATLATTFIGAGIAMSGPPSEKNKAPPVNASSKDEEIFIQEFIRNANLEEQKAKH
ncbi:hypothetical protein MMC25_001900 [Agyrium rufum]|nr:hypothetical protein [Agyrium rufum]